MDVATLTQFFGWMTVINIAILIVSSLFMMVLRDFGTALHARLFGLTRDQVLPVWYSYLGALKIAIIMLNLTPYLALRLFV